MIRFWEWLLIEGRTRELVPPSVMQSYEHAFKRALQRLIDRTQNPALKEKFKEMLDCPVRDRRGGCRGFGDYIVGALVHSGIADTYDIEAVLHYVAEKLLMNRSVESGERRTTVFDDFDETRPFGPDENPLQARFISFLRWAISNVRSGKVQRLSNVERR